MNGAPENRSVRNVSSATTTLARPAIPASKSLARKISTEPRRSVSSGRRGRGAPDATGAAVDPERDDGGTDEEDAGEHERRAVAAGRLEQCAGEERADGRARLVHEEDQPEHRADREASVDVGRQG